MPGAHACQPPFTRYGRSHAVFRSQAPPMSLTPPPGGKRRPPTRGARHPHGRPKTSLPGLLLFLLIIGLGLAALFAAFSHAHAIQAFTGADRPLALAGAAMIVIGLLQARKLIRG